VKRKTLELIDWSKRYPVESSLEIAIRQSTFCPCGKAKEIGNRTCGHDKPASRIVEYFYRGSLEINLTQGNGKQKLEQDIRAFEAWQRN